MASKQVISQEIPGTKTPLLLAFVTNFHHISVPTTRVGIADIVGFGVSGVVIFRNSINKQTYKVINDFGYDAGGWRVDKHVRLVADTTGNRQADVIGFGDGGVLISSNNGDNTFQDPKMAIQDFGYYAGWRVEKHIRFVADIRNTGRADIIGFGDIGVIVSLNNGTGSFAPGKLAVADFGYNAGYRIDRHPRFLGDVYGTGLLDIIAFADHGVVIGKNNGNGTFELGQTVMHGMGYNPGGPGWRVEKHPRFVYDLTGNGRVDLIGFADAGVYVALNEYGTFQAPKLVLEDFSCNAGGWYVEKHPRFIADVTGNKAGDIVGFANAGVYIAINNGDGTFQAKRKVIDDFGYVAGGWRVEKHLRFPVDLTGNGCADIIGFGDNGVLVSFNDGKGNFGPVQNILSQFAYNGGEWSLEKTVRLVANLYGV